MVKFFRFEPIDIELIRLGWEAAFSRGFDRKLWKEYWDWSFGSESLSPFPFVAYIQEDGVVASFIGVIPRDFLLGDKITKGGLAVAGFSHPQFQGQGLYKKLYSEAMAVFCEWGLGCLFAFDNHNSHYPEVKHLNWKDIGLLTEFSWEDNTSRALVFDQSYSVKSGIVSEEYLLSLCNFQFSFSQFSFLRDFSYLKWRLLDHPINRYHYSSVYQEGYMICSAVYKLYDFQTIDIMELFHSDLSNINWGAISALLNVWKQMGMKKVNLWSNLKTEEHLQLEKLGFVESRFSSYFVCLPLMSNSENMLELSRWHYRFLDSDVY